MSHLRNTALTLAGSILTTASESVQMVGEGPSGATYVNAYNQALVDVVRKTLDLPDNDETNGLIAVILAQLVHAVESGKGPLIEAFVDEVVLGSLA